ncbi:MAG: HDIG domain-containing protein [Spirochaetes bacterium]|nr:HDIG domain-containing protein [Spirochaetota bacterium]
MGRTREEAMALLQTYVKNDRMLKHSLASEAVMRALAARLGEDQDTWGIAGLLHDLDAEITEGDLSNHGLETEKILASQGYDPAIIDAVKMHNEAAHGMKRTTVFQHALAAGETITGLITATALVYPDKKVASVKPKSVVKRMKERAFAASVNRDTIMECERIGIPLAEFAAISIEAMQGIGEELGL